MSALTLPFRLINYSDNYKRFNTNFKESIDNTKQSNANIILKESTVTEAIAYLAQTYNINNVLMTPPDNIEMYDVLLIPPLSILKAFLYIDIYF